MKLCALTRRERVEIGYCVEIFSKSSHAIASQLKSRLQCRMIDLMHKRMNEHNYE